MTPRLTCDRRRRSTVTKRQEKLLHIARSLTTARRTACGHTTTSVRTKTSTEPQHTLVQHAMPILAPSAALASARAAGWEAGYVTAHLWLYMPASVGDVVHQEVLRQRRLGHDRHFVVEGHQVARQLPVVRSVGLVQDLSIVRQRVTSRNHRTESGVSHGACRASPNAVNAHLAANSAKTAPWKKKHHLSYVDSRRLKSSRAIRGKSHTCLRSEKSFCA